MIEQYNIDILKPKWSKWKKKIANFVLFNLKFLRIGRTNRMIKKFNHLSGGDFIQACIEEIGFEYEIHNGQGIPAEGPVTLCANHPGGADVVGTIGGLWNIRKDFSILANRLICVKPVMDIVIPVDLLKSKDKVDLDTIEEAYQNNRLVVFYAAGKNSRYNEKGELVDRRWRTTFLDYAYKYKTPIIIMNIITSNTPLFYKVARIREKYSFLKKVPLENMFQLREIFKQKGRKLDMFASRKISFEDWSKFYQPGNIKKNRELADKLYNTVYQLSKDNHNTIWDS